MHLSTLVCSFVMLGRRLHWRSVNLPFYVLFSLFLLTFLIACGHICQRWKLHLLLEMSHLGKQSSVSSVLCFLCKHARVQFFIILCCTVTTMMLVTVLRDVRIALWARLAWNHHHHHHHHYHQQHPHAKELAFWPLNSHYSVSKWACRV